MPPKALWMRFEEDDAFHWDFFLASKMGCTVAELHDRLSAAEWVAWTVYWARIGQARELQRLRAGG